MEEKYIPHHTRLFKSAPKYDKYLFKKDELKGGIALWGPYNELPGRLLRLSESSAWHHIAIEGVVKYVVGDGLITNEGEITTSANNEGETWNEIFTKAAYDYKIHGGFALEVIYDSNTMIGGTPVINEVYHINVADVRAEEANYRGTTRGYYVSSCWDKIGKNFSTDGYDEDIVEFLPSFNPSLASWNEEAGRPPQPKQLLFFRRHNPLSQYYPRPDYYGGLKDILIDQDISSFKSSFIKNATINSGINQIVGEFSDDDWKSFMGDMEFLQKNPGEVMSVNAKDNNSLHQFGSLPNMKNSTEAYGSWIDDATQRILSVHGIIFSMIVGIRDDDNAFGRDEVLDKFDVFNNTTIRDIQQPMLSGFDRIIRLHKDFQDTTRLQIQPVEFFIRAENPGTEIEGEEAPVDDTTTETTE